MIIKELQKVAGNQFKVFIYIKRGDELYLIHEGSIFDVAKQYLDYKILNIENEDGEIILVTVPVK